MNKVNKNILVYKWYSLFSELLIVGPIITLYLISKGMSFTQITLLQSIYSIGIVLFEVPTGAVADRISRKLSLGIGCLLGILGIGLYIYGQSFFIYLCAEVAFSLSRCFKSGADSALIYESLSLAGREKEYQSVEGSAKQYMYYAQGIGSVIASILYGVNKELPLIISIINFSVAFVISLFFIEEKIEHDSSKGYLEHINHSFKYIMNHQKVKSVVLYSMFIALFLRMGFWYYQPYMVEVDIPVYLFGALFFMFNLVAARSSKNSDRFIKLTKGRTLMAMIGLIALSYIILGSTKIWIGVFAILGQQVVRGISIPIIRKYINKHIEDNQRATILSFNSLASNLAVAVFLPMAGWLLDKSNIYFAHLTLGIALLLVGVLINIYTRDKLSKPESILSKQG